MNWSVYRFEVSTNLNLFEFSAMRHAVPRSLYVKSALIQSITISVDDLLKNT